ncbi:MAG: hypothetical protein FRX49_09341 [Trebouxia sp. A1-2]|nr:MAG: hypothetical protein FRX49_09341 [Trebouxia sp. A1-2]
MPKGENFDGFNDYKAGNDGIGRGNGMDDVSRHALQHMIRVTDATGLEARLDLDKSPRPASGKHLGPLLLSALLHPPGQPEGRPHPALLQGPGWGLMGQPPHPGRRGQSDEGWVFLVNITCPRYPAVPDSIKGVSAAKHSLLTWRRASKLSKPFMTRSKDLKKSTSYWGSLTLPYMTAGHFIIESCGYNMVPSWQHVVSPNYQTQVKGEW